MWFIVLMWILLWLSEHIGAILLIVLALALVGLIAEHIEIASIILGVLSLIICSLCYNRITDYCFDKGIIGLFFAIAAHIFFFLSLGLSGWLIFILIIVDFCALYAYAECEECEVISILIALASIIIPTILILKN